MRTLQQPPDSPTKPPGLLLSTADGRQFRFTQTFSVGRSADCDVCIDDSHVSRKHVSVEFDRGRWRARDLQSSNGIFVNNQRVQSMPIDKPLTLRLGGVDGPMLALQPEGRCGGNDACTSRGRPDEGARELCGRYFSAKSANQPAGQRTLLIRKAFENVQRKQKRRFVWILAIMTVVAVPSRATRTTAIDRCASNRRSPKSCSTR